MGTERKIKFGEWKRMDLDEGLTLTSTLCRMPFSPDHAAFRAFFSRRPGFYRCYRICGEWSKTSEGDSFCFIGLAKAGSFMVDSWLQEVS